MSTGGVLGARADDRRGMISLRVECMRLIHHRAREARQVASHVQLACLSQLSRIPPAETQSLHQAGIVLAPTRLLPSVARPICAVHAFQRRRAVDLQGAVRYRQVGVCAKTRIAIPGVARRQGERPRARAWRVRRKRHAPARGTRIATLPGLCPGTMSGESGEGAFGRAARGGPGRSGS